MSNPTYKGLNINMKSVVVYVVALFLTLTLAACGSSGDKRSEAFVDQDGDKIADAKDECANTAAGSVVNAVGCALFAGPIQNLAFQPGDHRLDSSSREALDQLIADLNQHPDVAISLGGHTDNRGKAQDNLQLSKLRVMSVVRYLVSNGIAPTRLKPYGYGESRPVVSNATLEGRIRNRRIEVNVIAQ